MTDIDAESRAEQTPAGETLADERFVLKRRLGSGSTGTVYAAFDRKRGEAVALKVLTYRSATALYRFKREFRTLVDVVHPNLISFYELVADDDDEVFFTMELIEGAGLLDYVRPATTKPGDPVLREGRLRDVLGQLAVAVKALHDHDKIHCDLKPNNVLVDSSGRVVILDFGISRDLAPTMTPQSLYQGLSGTVPYMSPEQARGQAPRPASDWYAVGVILFKALTGRLPFEGSLVDVLSAKVSKRAPLPSVASSDLPRDLSELCTDLLEIEAEKRPGGAEVLVRLGVEAAETSDDGDQGALRPARSELAAIGRQEALEALRGAFEVSRRGHAAAVYVHGESGLGKTALVRHFLWELVEKHGALVLSGRCYEREHVPYKALDGVIDSMSRFLNRAGDVEAPDDAGALCRLFPVLRRVVSIEEAVRDQEVPDQEASDRLSLRRRAFDSLRGLLTRIAAECPLVLYVDDLHWADADSTMLVHELLQPSWLPRSGRRAPSPGPPLLLVASFRSEEVAAKPFLAELLCETGTERCREVRLEPLDDDSAGRLARALLAEADELEALLGAIVREAQGSPFFIEQLVDYSRATESNLSSAVGLGELLDARVAQLPSGAESLVRTLAAAGRPLDTAVAYEAAGLTGDERPLIAALKAAHLIRASVTADHVELFHNRIRETMAERLESGEVRTIHARLAAALDARGVDDPEALYEHLYHAGDTRRAAEEAARAAAKARAALAFDRASQFFRRALELTGHDDAPQRHGLLVGLAECLSHAGHASEAARAYLELAELEDLRDAFEALRYRQKAAEEYLAAGHCDEGLEVVRGVGREVGLELPASRSEAITSILWNRLRLRLRGLGFRRREVAQVPREELLRADACFIMAASLAHDWPLHGNYAQTRHLLLALHTGEPLRLSRALNLESSYRAAIGASGTETARLRHTARELAGGDSQAEGYCLLHEGVAAYLSGRWRQGAETCEKAEAYYRERVPGGAWEVHVAQRFALSCRLYLGELGTLGQRVWELTAEARERGNVLALCELFTRLHATWLARDDPGGCREALEEALSLRVRDEFGVTHYNALLGRCHADLYEGDGEAAWVYLAENWPRLERSRLRRLRLLDHEAQFLRGRVALAAATLEPRRNRFKLAARSADALARGKTAYAPAMAALLRAGLAGFEGKADRSRALLDKAIHGFDTQEMALHATAARRCQGQLLGDEDVVAAADTWMRRQQIERPDRFAAMLAPGFAG